MSAFPFKNSASPNGPPDKGPGTILAALAALMGLCVIPAIEFAVYLFASPGIILAGCVLAVVAILVRLVIATPTSAEKIAAGCMVAALAGAGVWAGLNAFPSHDPAKPPLVQVLSDVPIDGRATAITEDSTGNVWVASEAGEIQAIDPKSRQPVGSALHVSKRIHALQALGHFLFAIIGRGTLVRLDPSPSPVPAAHLRFGKGGGKITSGAHSIWIADQTQPLIIRVSATPLKRIAVIRLSKRRAARATALSFGDDGYLWVVDAGLSRLYKIDPKTNRVVFSKPVLREPEEVLVRDGVIAIAHPCIRTLERFDEISTTPIGEPERLSVGPTKLAAGGGFLFAIAYLTSSVAVYSLSTGRRIGVKLRVTESPTDATFSSSRALGWIINSTSTSITPISLTAATAESRR